MELLKNKLEKLVSVTQLSQHIFLNNACINDA